MPECKQCLDTGIVVITTILYPLGVTMGQQIPVVCGCQLNKLREQMAYARPDIPPGAGMIIGGMQH